MTPAEIFDQEMSAHGGRFDFTSAPAVVRAAYEQVESRARDLIESVRRVLPVPDIYFGFVRNPGINAIASRAHGQYFIGLTTGALFMLRLVIGRMLADAAAFPHVGTASAERTDLEPVAAYFPHADRMLRENALLSPRDPVRAAFGEFLQDQAIMFYLGHEIAHITRGHVDLLVAGPGGRRTVEVENAPMGEDQLIERQSLEIDADRRSIMSRIDSLRLTIQSPDYEAPPWGGGPAGLVSDWCISMNIAFRLFGDSQFAHHGLASSNYPPLGLRLSMCEAAAYWSAGQCWGAEMKNVMIKALAVGRLRAVHAFEAILPPGTRLQDTSPTVAFRDHAIRLENHWNKVLRPKLAEYCYEPLTPPVSAHSPAGGSARPTSPGNS